MTFISKEFHCVGKGALLTIEFRGRLKGKGYEGKGYDLSSQSDALLQPRLAVGTNY